MKKYVQHVMQYIARNWMILTFLLCVMVFLSGVVLFMIRSTKIFYFAGCALIVVYSCFLFYKIAEKK